MAFLYMGAFTIGFQATVWVYPRECRAGYRERATESLATLSHLPSPAEILPLRIRAKGTALATFCNWIINFAVVKIFPISITNIGWKTYIIFTVFNASFVPVMVSRYYGETSAPQHQLTGVMSFGLAVLVLPGDQSKYPASMPACPSPSRRPPVDGSSFSSTSAPAGKESRGHRSSLLQDARDQHPRRQDGGPPLREGRTEAALNISGGCGWRVSRLQRLLKSRLRPRWDVAALGCVRRSA